MNKVFLTLALLLPSLSQALGGGGSAGGNGNSLTRMELLKLNRYYVINMPALTFEGRQVGIGNLCINDTEVRTIDPVLFETYETDFRDRIVKVERERKSLAQPLYQKVVECLEFKQGRCSNYTETFKKISTEFNVEAYEIPRGQHSEGPLKYKAKYQLPPCNHPY